jgi:hypothetical protein
VKSEKALYGIEYAKSDLLMLLGTVVFYTVGEPPSVID